MFEILIDFRTSALQNLGKCWNRKKVVDNYRYSVFEFECPLTWVQTVMFLLIFVHFQFGTLKCYKISYKHFHKWYLYTMVHNVYVLTIYQFLFSNLPCNLYLVKISFIEYMLLYSGYFCFLLNWYCSIWCLMLALSYH